MILKYKGFRLGVQNTYEIPTVRLWQKLLQESDLVEISQEEYVKILERHYAYSLLFNKPTYQGQNIEVIQNHHFLPDNLKKLIIRYLRELDRPENLEAMLLKDRLYFDIKYGILEAWITEISTKLSIEYSVKQINFEIPEWYKDNVDFELELLDKD